MVLIMKWLIVMMRVMIRLTSIHMKIIFNRCNAIFLNFAPISKYIFLHVLICLLLIAGCWTKMVGCWLRTTRRRRSTRRTAKEAQRDDDVQQQVEQQTAVDAAQQDNDDAQQDTSGSGA
jgi:type VI protein secretion system component VasK